MSNYFYSLEMLVLDWAGPMAYEWALDVDLHFLANEENQ